MRRRNSTHSILCKCESEVVFLRLGWLYLAMNRYSYLFVSSIRMSDVFMSYALFDAFPEYSTSRASPCHVPCLCSLLPYPGTGIYMRRFSLASVLLQDLLPAVDYNFDFFTTFCTKPILHVAADPHHQVARYLAISNCRMTGVTPHSALKITLLQSRFTSPRRSISARRDTEPWYAQPFEPYNVKFRVLFNIEYEALCGLAYGRHTN